MQLHHTCSLELDQTPGARFSVYHIRTRCRNIYSCIGRNLANRHIGHDGPGRYRPNIIFKKGYRDLLNYAIGTSINGYGVYIQYL